MIQPLSKNSIENVVIKDKMSDWKPSCAKIELVLTDFLLLKYIFLPYMGRSLKININLTLLIFWIENKVKEF